MRGEWSNYQGKNKRVTLPRSPCARSSCSAPSLLNTAPIFVGTRTREAETLRAGLERAQGILTKAQRLVSQLGGEQQRWQDQAMSLSDELSTLPLKMLLAAGFATYLVRLVGRKREYSQHTVRRKQLCFVRWSVFPFRTAVVSLATITILPAPPIAIGFPLGCVYGV